MAYAIATLACGDFGLRATPVIDSEVRISAAAAHANFRIEIPAKFVVIR
jgi:hypothetical protein